MCVLLLDVFVYNALTNETKLLIRRAMQSERNKRGHSALQASKKHVRPLERGAGAAPP